MAYKSRKEKFRTQSNLYTHKISYTVSETVDLPNGMTVEEPKIVWWRWAALYESSMTSTTKVTGYDSTVDSQWCVHRVSNDPFMSMTFDTSAIIRLDNDDKTEYHIKNIDRATTNNGVHIITLTTKLNQTPDTSNNSGNSGGGYY